jgi:hypothetical protein
VYGQAVQLFKEGRWPKAFGRFCAAGSAGDADGARICLFMHQYGPTLYGSHWDASQDDLDYWKKVAGRGVGRAQPEFTSHHANAALRPNAARGKAGEARKAPVRVGLQSSGS